MRPEGQNPCRRVKRFPECPRERYLSESELARLGTALRKVEAEEPTGAGLIAAIRLIILTGARRGEVLNLQWSEVAFEAGLLRLRDSKTGPKIVRLGAAALQLLAGLERQSPVWVFPRTDGTKPIPTSALWRVWTNVRARAGLEDLRLHDLRHTYASTGINGGASLPVIGALLGHNRFETTRRYAHLSDDPVREASERIDSTIAAALDGKPAAEVVPLRASGEA